MSARIEAGASIEGLVRMSLGTDKGAWHADPEFGSELWLLKKTGRIDGQTMGELERMAKEALRWLVADGLARSVDCRAGRGGRDRIGYVVTVVRPDGSPVTVREAWDVV